jgi:hypothetical protein
MLIRAFDVCLPSAFIAEGGAVDSLGTRLIGYKVDPGGIIRQADHAAWYLEGKAA